VVNNVVVMSREEWQALLAAQQQTNGRKYYHLAYGILRRSEAAEDACQQAFLKAWENREKIRDVAVLDAWLSRVVINQSFEVIRRQKTETQKTEEIGRRQEPTASGEVVIDQRDLVIAALGELPELTRSVVTLRIMHSMSGNETSRQLGLSPSEVSRRLHDGLGRLRRYISRIEHPMGEARE